MTRTLMILGLCLLLVVGNGCLTAAALGHPIENFNPNLSLGGGGGQGAVLALVVVGGVVAADIGLATLVLLCRGIYWIFAGPRPAYATSWRDSGPEHPERAPMPHRLRRAERPAPVIPSRGATLRPRG